MMLLYVYKVFGVDGGFMEEWMLWLVKVLVVVLVEMVSKFGVLKLGL